MPFTIPDELGEVDAALLKQATGWYELGLMRDGVECLNALSSGGSWHQSVLKLRINLLRRSGNFDMALDLAYEFTDAHANRSESWLALASVYRAAGEPEKALSCLLAVQNQFLSEPLFVYELVRCVCDCSKLHEGATWLSLALSLGNKETQKAIQRAALDDPRLERLWLKRQS